MQGKASASTLLPGLLPTICLTHLHDSQHAGRVVLLAS